jgi:hypothetical protein
VFSVEICINAIDATDSLHQARWIPGNIIVDDHVRAVKTYAFGEHFSRDQNSVIVLGLKCSRIEVGENCFAFSFVR